ncbi:MAG: bifunctional sugar-1-phosphate nucleotidylyltransferase/acetyltransferase [Methanomicrobiales archaeon]
MECVVLAAGEGRRMRPLTANRPKVMLPLANRPILEHLIVAARDAGITEFILVVGYREREVRSCFGNGERLGVRIRYATQRRQLGTGDALRACEGLVTGPFLLLNGDLVTRSGDLRALVGHEPPVMGVSHSARPQDFGTVRMEGDRVLDLAEKVPNPRGDLVNAGAYLLDPEIFGLLGSIGPSERGEYEITDALSALIREEKLAGYPLSFWLDVGYPWDLLSANEMLLSDRDFGREGTVEPGAVLDGDVAVGPGSVIRTGTVIEGPCIIGRDCRIGPHAYIRGATSIGNDCHIGHGSEVKNSVILAGTKVPHLNYVGDSIIGSSCNLGAGTKIANLRNDRKPVQACGRDTGRLKFGAVVGDGVSFGINCSLNAGTVVGSGCSFAPQSYIHGCIMDGTEMR